MSKDNDAPAYPVTAGNQVYATGMTKREYFAASALVGLMNDCSGYYRPEHAATQAVEFADALIAALAKEPKP